jgi:hypothetical protein
MYNKIIIAAVCLSLGGCATNWEYVRIENQIPDKSCVYKMQEACSQAANACLNWHKKRAAKFGANTVVVTQSGNQQQYATGAFGIKGGENTSTLADYYFCNGAKNITPKTSN